MTSSTDVSTFAASYGQQRLWFLCQLDSMADKAYHLSTAIRVIGPLDTVRLREALDFLVQRHETLRTTFRLARSAETDLGDELVQEVAPTGRVGWREENLQGATEQAITAAVLDERDRPFDLEWGPLLRAFAARLGNDEYLVCLTAHHITGDGWSMAVLGRELSAVYRDLSQGREPQLPELSIQYADFAEWQRQQPMAGGLGWWREQLAGLPPLQTPADRSRPLRQSFAGARLPLDLGAQLTSRIGELAREHRATEFMVLLAAWQAVLGRLSGQEDFGIGTPVAGRTRPELEALIGFFVNTVVLRADLSGNPTFTELIVRTRENALNAFAHQDTPFEKIVETLAPNRDLSLPPLFQAALTYQNTPQAALDLAGTRTERVTLPTAASAFDLNLLLRPGDSGISGHLEYAAALFDESSAERIAGYLRLFLEQAVTRPQASIAELMPLSAQDTEANRVLTGDRAVSGEPLVLQRFWNNVRASPGTVAVLAGDDTTTYAQLGVRSSQLSHWLSANGVTPGSSVAVSLPREADLIAALVAVWQAGAAYIPVDPDFPEDRQRYMQTDAGAAMMLTEQTLNDAASEIAGLPMEPGAHVPHPRDLACLIYTSGSTGTPKGIEVEHGQLSSIVATMAQLVNLEPGLVWAALTTVSFDIAGLEIWGPLSTGGTVALVAHGDLVDPASLSEAIAGANAIQATPTVWRSLTNTGWRPAQGMRLMTAGEPLPADLASILTGTGARLWNAYGPTETTVWSTAAEVTGNRPVTIGRALPGEWLAISDRYGYPVPAGAPGELLIGGIGVTRGYHGKPGLTAAKFVPDPTSYGGRRYRTGDVVRLGTDGELIYLGRADGQIKLRGHRIEPAEVETALRGYPGIRDAAVRVHGEGETATLAAYLVAPDGTPDPAAIRQYLAAKLPTAMVPGTYLVLDELPRTPNGKLDRGRLPDPTGAVQTSDAAPQNAVQATILRIWQELLGRSDFGIHDHFFHVGGHSMLAARLVGNIRDELGVRLSIGQVFSLGTVAELAAALDVPAGVGGPPQARQVDDDLAEMWRNETGKDLK